MSRWSEAWRALTGANARAPNSAVSTSADAMMASILTGRKPPPRGTDGMLLAYSSMPRLRAIIDRISWAISSTPVQVYRVRGANPRSVSQKIASAPHVRMGRDTMRAKTVKSLVADGNLEPLTSHPVLDVLHRATPRLTATQRTQVTQAMLELTGEAFLLKERLGGPATRELWPVPPTWVNLPDKLDAPYELTGNIRKKVAQEEIIYLRHPNPANPYDRGTGIAGTLNDELDADENAAKTASAFFYNQGLPAAIVSFEGGDKEQAERVKAKFDAKYRGARKANSIEFTNNKVSVNQLSQKFVDMHLVELREFEAKIVRETLGVPPEILGVVENSNRATITQADNIFARWVLVPRLDFLFDYYNAHLAPEFDENVILVYESPVQTDFDFALEAARVAPWARTLNDWRAWMGDAPLEGPLGGKIFVPFGLTPMDPATGEIDTGDETPKPAAAETEPEKPAEDDDSDKTYQVDPSVVIALAEYAPREERARMAKAAAERIQRVEAAKQDSRIEAIISALDPADLAKLVDPLWRDQVLDWMADELRTLGVDIDVNLIGRLAAEHVRKLSSDRITGLVNETTRRQLRESLAEGLANGETNRELIGRVSDTMDLAIGPRSENIARTETLRSSNWAIWQGQTLGGVERRQWVAIMDQHVRPTHAALNGQVRNLGEPFELGVKKAMYPGDFNDPAEDCQCRCVTISLLSESDEERSTRLNPEVVAKRFDARLSAWDKAATRALRRGFKAQKKAVLARAERVLERAASEGATA